MGKATKKNNGGNFINRISGSGVHRYLMQEAYKFFSNQGYEVFLEYQPFENSRIRADVFAQKGKEKIAIECMLRPILIYLNQKKENYKDKKVKLYLFYPSDFIPTIPLENFVDKFFPIEIPQKLIEGKTTITISPKTWEELNKRKRLGDSMDDILQRMFLETPEEKDEN